MHVNEYLPDNMKWIKGKGIVRGDDEKLVNAVPIVLGRSKITDYTENAVKDIVKIRYLTNDETWIGEEQEFETKDIMSGKFMKELPIEVEMGNARIRVIFQKIIQVQVRKTFTEDIVLYKFGWKGKVFHWNDEDKQGISAEQEYNAAFRVADILKEDNRTVISLVLAAVHGPLKRILLLAGIRHDFTTFIAGKSGVGKTALAKKICGSVHKAVIFSLSSDRKQLRKRLQSMTDITVVVDDFNTSASDRVVSRQLQLVSEIVQATCNTGDVLIGETHTDQEDNCIHIVVTSESIIRNVSTMNRCFLINMEEPVPDEIWDKIIKMEDQKVFYAFARTFIHYIERNCDEVILRCRNDFEYLKQFAKKNLRLASNRIAETLAVQYTLNKLIFEYLQTLKIERRLCDIVRQSVNRCIGICGQELQQEINQIELKKSYMELLPELAEIISSDGYGYEMAENEDKYQRKIRKNKKCIGFQKNPGYVSFNPRYMCQMLSDKLNLDAVSVNCLSKELSYYQLAHVDISEQKQSCRWHTKDKYFHVSFRELMELIYGCDNELLEESIQKFENMKNYE